MVHIYDDVRVETRHDVYKPSHDTHLLVDAVGSLRPGRLLDVGTGTGLVAIAAAREGHEVVATDLNPHAVRLARGNAADAGVAVDVVRAHLAAGLDLGAFDVVTVNPPYLPTTDRERIGGYLNAAFDGGPTGIDVATAFVRQLPADGPPAYMVVSTRQDLETLEERVEARGLARRVVAERRLPGFERLAVWRVAGTSST